MIWGFLSNLGSIVAWCLLVGYAVSIALWPVVKGVGEAFVGVLDPHRPMRGALPDPALLGSPQPGGWIHKLRRRAIRRLASFVETVLWPAAAWSGETLHTVGTGSARVLHPRFWTYAVVSASFAVALIGLRAWSGPSTAVTFAAVALLMALTARHLLWFFSGEEFLRLLKRSGPNPYVTLVTLATVDFIALLAIAIVVRWTERDGFDVQWVIAEGQDLLALRKLTSLPARADLDPQVVVLAVAVAAYWTSLAGQVLKVFRFGRSPDDRAWVAALYLSQGDIAAAGNVMSRVPAEQVSEPILQSRIRLALVCSEHEDALKLSRTLAHLVDREQATEEGAIVFLAMEWASMPPSLHAAETIVRVACDARVSDGAMFVVLRSLGSGGWTVADGWESRVTELGLTPETYPIAWSWMQHSTAATDDALQTLKETDPASETDIAVCAVARHAVVRRRTAFGIERNDVDQELSGVVRVLSPLALEKLPLWLRQFIFKATWSLERRGGSSPEHWHDLRTIRRRLLAMPKDDAEAVLKDFDVTEQARVHGNMTGLDSMFGKRPP